MIRAPARPGSAAATDGAREAAEHARTATIDLAFADHQNRLDMGELAARAATSVRTLSWLFPAETGLNIQAWRQRVRIAHAMDRLARDNAITKVSAEAGFASTAAFPCAFRQVTAMARRRSSAGRTWRAHRHPNRTQMLYYFVKRRTHQMQHLARSNGRC